MTVSEARRLTVIATQREPDAPSPQAAALMSTLAFEAIVDAVLLFHVRVGILATNRIQPTTRHRYREVIAGMLNAMDPVEGARAVGAAAATIAKAESSEPTIDDIHRSIQAYHRHLQSTPVAGVGQLR